MERRELAEAIRDSFDAGEFGDASTYISEVTEVASDDATGFATFSVHVGGLAADIFHVRVYKGVR